MRAGGPGTELHTLLAELGIHFHALCAGAAWTGKMDDWGSPGCQEHRGEIVAWLRDSYVKCGLQQLLLDASAASKTEPAFRFPMLDPATHLVEEALRRAARPHTESVRSSATPASTALPPCQYLGAETGETKTCSSCRGGVQLKVLECGKHTRCTIAKPIQGLACCATCPDRAPRFKKHLLYHIYPARGNGLWQWNVAQLLRRISLFDGQRVVAIVTGPELDAPRVVQEAFAGAGVDFLIRPNNRQLRDGGTLQALLERVLAPGRASEVLFWGHAKAVTRPRHPTARRWAEMLYEVNLDHWPLVSQQLAKFPITGAFKKHGYGFTGSTSSWHYSGSFFWARCADLHARSWRAMENHDCAIETYPSNQFRSAEAGCLFHEGRVPNLDLYNPGYVGSTVEPLLAHWHTQRELEEAL